MLELGLAVLAVLLIAVSQLLFKYAARQDRGARATMLQTPVIVGLGLNAVAAASWVAALSRHEINFLFPLLSLNYLLVPLGAWWCFGERLGRGRLAAIALVVAGVVLCLAAG